MLHAPAVPIVDTLDQPLLSLPNALPKLSCRLTLERAQLQRDPSACYSTSRWRKEQSSNAPGGSSKGHQSNSPSNLKPTILRLHVPILLLLPTLPDVAGEVPTPPHFELVLQTRS